MTAQAHAATQVQMDVPAKKEALLRNALRANAAFSIVSGLLLMAASQPVAEFLGITETQVFGSIAGSTFIGVLGIGILLFGLDVAYVATRPALNRLAVWGILGADVDWAIASVVVLLAHALPLTTAGSWVVLTVVDIVSAFAIVQYLGLRRMRRA